jgi:predicted TIM-barrel fold metal-dependent hydrolase
MIIDFHAHIGDFSTPRSLDRPPVTWQSLLSRLDEEGIDRAVLLPMGMTPESTQFPAWLSGRPGLTALLEEAADHPDRIVPFGCLDPRMACAGNLTAEDFPEPRETDFSWILDRLIALGCRGIGEITANIPVDDPRMVNLARQCGACGLPLLLHLTGPGPGVYGLVDPVGLPGLERLLVLAQETVIIGHAPGFWSEIDADVTPEQKFLYPDGPVRREGALSRLLRTYPNLYADISAASGFNALSRDRAFGTRFLTEFQDRIIFGTDLCFADQRAPQLSYLRALAADGELQAEAFARIMGDNAARLLGLA